MFGAGLAKGADYAEPGAYNGGLGVGPQRGPGAELLVGDQGHKAPWSWKPFVHFHTKEGQKLRISVKAHSSVWGRPILAAMISAYFWSMGGTWSTNAWICQWFRALSHFHHSYLETHVHICQLSTFWWFCLQTQWMYMHVLSGPPHSTQLLRVLLGAQSNITLVV